MRKVHKVQTKFKGSRIDWSVLLDISVQTEFETMTTIIHKELWDTAIPDNDNFIHYFRLISSHITEIRVREKDNTYLSSAFGHGCSFDKRVKIGNNSGFGCSWHNESGLEIGSAVD